jgi:hypothetical protein
METVVIAVLVEMLLWSVKMPKWSAQLRQEAMLSPLR